MGILDTLRQQYRASRRPAPVYTPDLAFALEAGRPTAQVRDLNNRWGLDDIVDRPHQYTSELRRAGTTLDTLRAIRDLHPDASQAVMNFQNLAVKGLQLKAYGLAFDSEGNPVEHPEAQAWADAFQRHVGADYGGGIHQFARMIVLEYATQGAVAAEVEATPDIADVVDWHPVEASRVDLQRKDGRLVPVMQDAGGKWVELNREQFRFQPFDPAINSPHGRSPILASLTTIFFQAQLMSDLQRVVRKGYARIDATLLTEKMAKYVPERLNLPGMEEQRREWLQARMDEIATAINGLQPDSVWIHSDVVQMGGVAVGSPSIDLKMVITALDTQIVAALKQLPILLGRNEGATTTHATVQWEIFAETIGAIQLVVKALLEWLFEVSLRIKGIEARIEVVFEKPRTGDRLGDAQAREAEMRSHQMAFEHGLIDRDEWAQLMYGHFAVEDGTATGLSAGGSELKQPDGMLLKP